MNDSLRLEILGEPTGELWQELASVQALQSWPRLRERFAAQIAGGFEAWITPDQANFGQQLRFALGRFDEGAGIVRFFERGGGFRPATALWVLDVGAGNGGVILAMANCRRYEAFALDIVPNGDLIRCARNMDLSVRATVGSGNWLPFRSEQFDIVLLLDMIEHVSQPRLLGREVMRVLRPGGVCMLTTPPRLRYALRPDPHFGIRGLVLLPNGLQRFVVNHIARRRVRDHLGQEVPAYDVEHIFWHASEITRLFPGRKEVELLFNTLLDGGAPKFSRRWLHFKARAMFWDRILIRKPAAAKD